mmetsp:Transcript_36739/g.105876  ORF Transcript_36739/g.105876 Transcript_36739/m.105876 type:complete len:236 (+) Transcript_36739:751-1458(+)
MQTPHHRGEGPEGAAVPTGYNVSAVQLLSCAPGSQATPPASSVSAALAAASRALRTERAARPSCAWGQRGRLAPPATEALASAVPGTHSRPAAQQVRACQPALPRPRRLRQPPSPLQDRRRPARHPVCAPRAAAAAAARGCCTAAADPAPPRTWPSRPRRRHLHAAPRAPRQRTWSRRWRSAAAVRQRCSPCCRTILPWGGGSKQLMQTWQDCVPPMGEAWGGAAPRSQSSRSRR